MIVEISDREVSAEEWAVDFAVECFLDAIAARENGGLIFDPPGWNRPSWPYPEGVVYIDDMPLMEGRL